MLELYLEKVGRLDPQERVSFGIFENFENSNFLKIPHRQRALIWEMLEALHGEFKVGMLFDATSTGHPPHPVHPLFKSGWRII